MERRKLMRALLTLGVTGAATSVPMLAAARVGRPATPGSVAGVRRRTRRRTRRRVYRGMRLTTLPYGCSTTVMYNGMNHYYCGGIYYQPSYQGTTVVYVVVNIEDGANTDVEFEEYD